MPYYMHLSLVEKFGSNRPYLVWHKRKRKIVKCKSVEQLKFSLEGYLIGKNNFIRSPKVFFLNPITRLNTSLIACIAVDSGNTDHTLTQFSYYINYILRTCVTFISNCANSANDKWRIYNLVIAYKKFTFHRFYKSYFFIWYIIL